MDPQTIVDTVIQ